MLHSAVQDDVVESTADDVVNAFSKSILNTESSELKVQCSFAKFFYFSNNFSVGNVMFLSRLSYLYSL